MLVTNLDTMEKIVSSRSDLDWDGWDVVKFTKNSNAVTSPDGILRNGQWMKHRRFPITEQGWDVPHSIGRTDA